MPADDWSRNCALAPQGNRRMGANPHANGGLLKRVLRLPDFHNYAAKVDKPATTRAENTRPLGEFLRFDSLFTTDKPILFNFHGYPWLIHRLTYRRTNHNNLHVRGYKEKGNINTPLQLAIQNQIDRVTLAMDVIDRVPQLRVIGAHAKENFRNMQIDCENYAYQYGVVKPEVRDWTWPF